VGEHVRTFRGLIQCLSKGTGQVTPLAADPRGCLSSEIRRYKPKLPIAKVVLDQAQHPYDSFVTADYTQVSQAIGTEVQKALQGQKTAVEAITEAHELVTAIVKRRG